MTQGDKVVFNPGIHVGSKIYPAKKDGVVAVTCPGFLLTMFP